MSEHSRLNKIRDRFNRLEGRRDYLVERKSKLALERDDIQKKMQLNPQVLSVLERMQSRVHRGQVETYENLLTQAMRDVLPNSKGNVRFDVSIERNLPAMSIFIENNGKPEDIERGRGGSLSNTLSTALRFIAINKMPVRRFVALDEQDCWLKKIHVDAYMGMVNKLSLGAGMQSLIISHNKFNEQLLPNAQIIGLSDLGNANINVEIIQPGSSAFETDEDWAQIDNEMMDGVGIRYIRLVNVMSHANTMIPLCPGTNFIVGDNDIGKSVVIGALKAIFYNDSDDTMIRHDTSEMRIELGLEDGMTMIYRRLATPVRRNGQHQKVGYELLDDAGQSVEEYWGASSVPEFVKEVLGVDLVDGDTDIHIASQSKSVFLVDRATTPSKRASMLSIGGEMQRIHNMIQTNNSLRQQRRQRLKQIEIEIEKIDRTLTALRDLNQIEGALDYACQKEAEIKKSQEEFEIAKKVFYNWRSLYVMNQAMAGFDELKPASTEKLPLDQEVQRYASIADKFIVWIKLAKLKSAMDQISAPQFTQYPNPVKEVVASDTLVRWQHLDYAKSKFSTLDRVKPPVSAQTINAIRPEANELLLVWTSASEQQALMTKESRDLEVQLGSVKREHQAVLEELGGICPLCERPVSDHDNATHIKT